MAKMDTMPIYSKTPSKIFSGTAEPIATKVDMQLLRLEHYHVCINHDHVMTLTDLRQGQHRSHIQKTVKMSLKFGQL